RLATIQGEGTNPLFRALQSDIEDFERVHAGTVATAIKIGNPVNYPKAVRTSEWTNGFVEQVHDQETIAAKALIDGEGIGCEPAAGCSLAGVRKLVRSGIIKPHETIVGILTGHLLKDPDATIAYHRDNLEAIHAQYPNHIHEAAPSVSEIARILSSGGE